MRSNMIHTSDRGGGLWHIELQRPEKRNALGVAAYATLADDLLMIQGRPDARALLLSAQGKSFCAGNDLKEFGTEWPQPPDGPVIRFIRALHAVTMPVIAAVQGPAVGIGATLLLHCDMVVASPQAYLQYPFVDLGIVPEAASSLLLARQVGYRRSLELLLTGRAIPAQEALSLGLVTFLTKTDSPLEEAIALATGIAAKPAAAVAATKRLIRQDLSAMVDGRIGDEIEIINRLLSQSRTPA